MILHLDPSFKPIAGNEITFETFVFSGGEPHIKINPANDWSESVTITHRLNSFQDIGLLCLAVDALRRLGADISTLCIPYFPAARQDRAMVPGEPLSAKVYADIIHMLGFRKVIAFDPHSDVTPAVLDNCEVIPNHRFIELITKKITSPVLLVSPDAGALKKIYKVSEFLGGVQVVECGKRRDVHTGNLAGFTVHADDLGGKDCLIVDDICDGGGTFIGLANVLKSKNAGKLYLAVSHGIFSRGFDELEACFETIFTTDSIRNQAGNRLIQIPLRDILQTN